jgi:hypothetical protein
MVHPSSLARTKKMAPKGRQEAMRDEGWKRESDCIRRKFPMIVARICVARLTDALVAGNPNVMAEVVCVYSNGKQVVLGTLLWDTCTFLCESRSFISYSGLLGAVENISFQTIRSAGVYFSFGSTG